MIRKNHPLRGLCYIMAEALYHNGAKQRGFRPYRATWKGISHWWLQNNDEILDPTADQFKLPFPYHLGKPAGFLTNKPCARTQTLIAGFEDIRH